MRRLAVLAAALLLPAAPAFACLPPIPGEVEPPPPTLDQRADFIASRPVIVYGQVVAAHDNGTRGTFRVLHVYQGPVKAGARIAVTNEWGDNAPMCAGMIPPPPLFNGGYGIISYDDPTRPVLNWLDDQVRERMFERGLIQRATPKH